MSPARWLHDQWPGAADSLRLARFFSSIRFLIGVKSHAAALVSDFLRTVDISNEVNAC